MPPPYVRTIEDTIFYYYAKLVIAKSAGMSGNFRFITDQFKRLKSGDRHLSDYQREIAEQMKLEEKVCQYCGAKSVSFVLDHVVPLKRGGPAGAHNEVLACESCNSSKGDDDLISWWTKGLKRDKDELPRIPLGIYLKLCYDIHKIKGTLEKPHRSILGLWPIKKVKIVARRKS